MLLSRLGVREAITVFDRKPGRDSGEEIARRLGMTVRAWDRRGFRTAPGVDEAEFCSGQRGVDVVLAPAEAQLVGRVLVIGRYGDIALGLDPAKRLPDLRTLRDHVTAGGSLLEFRLRVGFLNFNPLYAGGLHVAALHAIGSSQAMKPWRVGGSYDRPIARRILEEAGIPREAFGVHKAASLAIHLESAAALSPAGRADFEAYRRSMPSAGWWRQRLQRGLVRIRARARKLGVPDRLIPVPRRYDRSNEMDFAMHWGHARVRPRYAEAVGEGSERAAPRHRLKQDPRAGLDQVRAGGSEVLDLLVIRSEPLEDGGERGGGRVGMHLGGDSSLLLRILDLAREVDDHRRERLAPHLLEAAIALVGGQVAHQQHRAVRIPVVDEGARDGARRLEALGAAPGAVDQLDHGGDLFGGQLGQPQRRLAHVLEILVEGGRRGVRLARDVDHRDVADALLLEQVGGGVEQALAGAERPRAQRAPALIQVRASAPPPSPRPGFTASHPPRL